jgi:RNA polymerase sigma factor (sigma-70 family)
MDASRDNGVVNAALVGRARAGDEGAWAELVRRYDPLLTKITCSYRLNADDAEDVRQMVWTRLFEHIHELREPRALPGWISTTAARTCLRVIQQRRRSVPVDTSDSQVMDRVKIAATWSGDESPAVDDDLVRTERRHAVRRGLAELTTSQRQLLLLLAADPPVPYAQISRQVGMPVGSIGPTRARLLRKLRDCRSVRSLHEEVLAGELAVA